MINEEIKPTTPSPFYFEPTPSTRKKLVILKVIACVIIPVVIGAGIALATRVWDPLWNPFRPSPEEVIGEMAVETGRLKTVHSRTKIEITGKEDAKEVFKLSMDFAGDSDNTDPENPKSTGEFYSVLAFEGTQFSLAGENKIIGEDSYIKLTTIPAFPFLEPFFNMLGLDLNQLKDQWIKLDLEEFMKELMEISGVPVTSEMEQELEEAEQRQQEMIQKFQALIKDKKLYIVKREYPDKEVRSEKTYHYLVALNEKEIKKIIPELYKILIDTMKFGPSPTEEQWQEFQEELSRELDKFFAKVGEISAQVWIGKKDYLLYKIKGEKEIDLSKFQEQERGVVPLPPQSKPTGMITIGLEINFSNFNQPLIIEAPGEYKTLEEIFKIPAFFPSSIPYSPELEFPSSGF